jgi:hypothetical protein
MIALASLVLAARVVLVTVPPPAHPGAPIPPGRVVGARTIARLLARTRALVLAGKTPVVAFDVDGTLLENAPGTSPLPSRRLVPGMRQLMDNFARAGAIVPYVTGRRRSVWDERTRAQFRAVGLPIDQRHPLLMNPFRAPGRALVWKRRAHKSLRALGIPVAAIDDDPAEAEAMRRGLPERAVTVLRVERR